MNYLTYTRATRPTALLLAEALGLERWGIRPPDFTPEVLIRWGSRRPMPRAGRVLNSSVAIGMSSNKLIALQAMRDNGVPTVPFFTSWDEAVENTEGTVILGRRATGMKGRGIVVFDPERIYGDTYYSRPVRQHDFYSVYQEPTREVRLHVVGSEVIRTQGKYNDFPEDNAVIPFVRNHDTGYRFRQPRLELNSSRKESAIKAVQACSLDFGAVDMLLFGEDRQEMVLEVNSAPSCSPLTLGKYAEAIQRLIERSEEHDSQI
jgi:hypothetical protein